MVDTCASAPPEEEQEDDEEKDDEEKDDEDEDADEEGAGKEVEPVAARTRRSGGEKSAPNRTAGTTIRTTTGAASLETSTSSNVPRPKPRGRLRLPDGASEHLRAKLAEMSEKDREAEVAQLNGLTDFELTRENNMAALWAERRKLGLDTDMGIGSGKGGNHLPRKRRRADQDDDDDYEAGRQTPNQALSRPRTRRDEASVSDNDDEGDSSSNNAGGNNCHELRTTVENLSPTPQNEDVLTAANAARAEEDDTSVGNNLQGTSLSAEQESENAHNSQGEVDLRLIHMHTTDSFFRSNRPQSQHHHRQH